MMNFGFYMPTKLLFGQGKFMELAQEALPGKKALIVISAGGSMKRTNILPTVQGLLAKQGCDSVVFDHIQPNPIVDHVMEGAALAKAEHCDFVIGLGGGSSIDSAKSIALMANNEGTYWDYMAGTGKKQTPAHPALPIVAIPTTAGTGTEVDPWTVITNPATQEKIGWGNDSTFPKLAIVDPLLMLTVPAKTTAYTGMDAFFHAVEAYLSLKSQPTSDLLAQQSIQLVTEFLPACIKNGNDPELRTMLAWASTASGICESLSSCISHHSLEHALSAFHPEIPHGAGLCMLCEAYFSHLIKASPKRCADIAWFMGANNEGLSTKEQAESFIVKLHELKEACGLNELKMSDYGVRPEELPAMAKNAMESMKKLFATTPMHMDEEDVLAIFQEAYS